MIKVVFMERIRLQGFYEIARLYTMPHKVLAKEYFYAIHIYYFLSTIDKVNENVAPLPSVLLIAHILPP